jgi:hypothetical protein
LRTRPALFSDLIDVRMADRKPARRARETGTPGHTDLQGAYFSI